MPSHQVFTKGPAMDFGVNFTMIFCRKLRKARF